MTKGFSSTTPSGKPGYRGGVTQGEVWPPTLDRNLCRRSGCSGRLHQRPGCYPLYFFGTDGKPNAATVVDQLLAMSFCTAVNRTFREQIARKVYDSTASLSLRSSSPEHSLRIAQVVGRDFRLCADRMANNEWSPHRPGYPDH